MVPVLIQTFLISSNKNKQIENDHAGSKKWQKASYLVPIAIFRPGTYTKNMRIAVSINSDQFPTEFLNYC